MLLTGQLRYRNDQSCFRSSPSRGRKRTENGPEIDIQACKDGCNGIAIALLDDRIRDNDRGGHNRRCNILDGGQCRHGGEGAQGEDGEGGDLGEKIT